MFSFVYPRMNSWAKMPKKFRKIVLLFFKHTRVNTVIIPVKDTKR